MGHSSCISHTLLGLRRTERKVVDFTADTSWIMTDTPSWGWIWNWRMETRSPEVQMPPD